MAIVHLGNILPGTAYTSGLDTRLPWSALEYSGGTKVITGISGSAIGGVGGGGVDSATVSAIASAYVVSGVSGKMDSSASSSFYPNNNPSGYVPISAVSSWSSDIQTLSAALSAIQTAMANVYTLSAGSGIQISSNTSTKVTVVQLS